MNYLDLFSGIGGFTLGLQQAGFNFDWLGHSETDRYANQIYEKHYSHSEPLGDVKAIKIDRLPKIHLITFGFPCQDLSIAGKRGGLTAKRSSLFFEAMRIIGDAKPDHFIFENVKGLFSSNGGQDWLVVLREIADSGYDGQWQLLNTRWFLPQNRERIYFVGHIRGRGRPKVFPIGENNGKSQSENESRMVQTENDISGCVQEGMGGRLGLDSSITLVRVGQIGKKDAKGQRVYSPDGIATAITGEGGGQGAKTGLYAIGNTNPSGRGQAGNVYDPKGIMPALCSGGDNPNRNRDVGYNFGKIASTIQEISPYQGDIVHQKDGIMSALPAQGGNKLKGLGLQDGMNIRRLTPIECERLQGFPDNWTEGISDTQRYKCLGNAVSVPVVKEIGERLL